MNEIRLPPQDLQAEQCVLACQILAGKSGYASVPGAIDRLSETLSPADFYSDVHVTIQKAILLSREANGGETDVVLVADQLARMGKLEDASPQYLTEILETVPHSGNVLHYAAIVAGCARRRKVIEVGQKMVDRAYDARYDDQEIVDDAFQTAAKMADAMQLQASGPRKLSAITQDVLDAYTRGESPSLFWGLDEIDRELGGVSLGSLVLIGARPRHGKSMVALQWLDCAAQAGIPGMMISEEMMELQLGSRTLLYLSDLPQDQHKSRVAELARQAEKHFAHRAPVLVVQKCSKIARAEKAIFRATRSHGVKIVAVDYAQLIDGEGDSEEQRISNVSKRMKQAAVRHGIIVILLAQLNRQIEHRENPTPKLSDLKGSGGLEADADVVLFPYWPVLFDDGYTPRDDYRVVVAKDRNGPAEGRVIEMRIDAARQRLLPADPTRRFDNF